MTEQDPGLVRTAGSLRAAAERLVARSCEAQGVEAVVTDLTTIATVSHVVRAATARERGADDRQTAA